MTINKVRVTAGLALASMVFSMHASAADAPKVEVPLAIQFQIKKLACNSCHGWERTKFGPSWQNVADRYRGKANYIYKGYNIDSVGVSMPLVQGLVKKISKGGVGEWNEYIPMAAIDPMGEHTNEITDIMNFILSIPPMN